MKSISYAICVCNEEEEIKTLIPFLLENKRQQDEIVVVFDLNNGTKEVFNYVSNVEGIVFRSLYFENDFATFKNKLNEFCQGDYIFNIDPDELPHTNLIKSIPEIIESNPNVELYWIPRINIVEGITQEDINRYGWRLNENNYINHPDYQSRIYKRSSNIKWVGKVHEQIKGELAYTHLPPVDEWSLYHKKNITKQRKQNELYNKI